MVSFRVAKEEDFDLVFAALKELRVYSKAPQMQWSDEDIAERHLRHAIKNRKLYIVGDFAVMADWGYPFWFSEKLALIEDFVIRIGHSVGNSVDDVPAALCEIARSYSDPKLDLVVTGDAQGGYIGNVYTKAGFTVVATQYIKEL